MGYTTGSLGSKMKDKMFNKKTFLLTITYIQKSMLCMCIVYVCVCIFPSSAHGKGLEAMIKPVAISMLETEQDPVGLSWVQKSFPASHFMFFGKRLWPPRPYLSSKGQIQTVTN